MNIGETVGNFEIISQLGKGGMGAVYLAQQKSVKTKVAIKVLHASISTNTTHVKRFHNEAVAVSEIHHSGIVRIFDVGFHTSGEAYLVMEYLQGETLTSRIKSRTRLGIGAVADFGRQIASVLDATHNAGITHRDLKPDNIYLVRDAELLNGERVKVLDFGIAKLVVPSTGGVPGAPRMTAMGVSSIGTPNYMSPEQWHSLAEADWRTDAYALGCVAFEMACGRPPFIGESMADICAQHLGEPPPIPSRLVPGIPPRLDHLIGRLLEKDPAGRPTMREAMQTFTELGHSEGIALSTLPPTMVSPFYQQPSPGASAPMGAALPFAPTQYPRPDSPAAGASQPFVPHPNPGTSKKPGRLGLIIALVAVALTGTTVAAVVIGSRASKPQPDASGGSAVVKASTVDASVAVVAKDAAVAVVVVAADAAVPVQVPVPNVLTATTPPDGVLNLRRIPPRKSGLAPEVKELVTLEICIDEYGGVTHVLPVDADPALRKQISEWTFSLYRDAKGKSIAVCGPLRLEPPKPPPLSQRGSNAPRGTPPEDGGGRGPNTPPPLIAESLSADTIRQKLDRISAAAMSCGKGQVTEAIEVVVIVAPKGYVQSARPAKDLVPGFAMCVETRLKLAHFDETKTGGKLTYTIKFRGY